MQLEVVDEGGRILRPGTSRSNRVRLRFGQLERPQALALGRDEGLPMMLSIPCPKGSPC